jgi:hypothetical protein
VLFELEHIPSNASTWSVIRTTRRWNETCRSGLLSAWPNLRSLSSTLASLADYRRASGAGSFTTWKPRPPLLPSGAGVRRRVLDDERQAVPLDRHVRWKLHSRWSARILPARLAHPTRRRASSRTSRTPTCGEERGWRQSRARPTTSTCRHSTRTPVNAVYVSGLSLAAA